MRISSQFVTGWLPSTLVLVDLPLRRLCASRSAESAVTARTLNNRGNFVLIAAIDTSAAIRVGSRLLTVVDDVGCDSIDSTLPWAGPKCSVSQLHGHCIVR